MAGLSKMIDESEVRLAEAVEHENWREITHLSACLSGLKQAQAIFEQVEQSPAPANERGLIRQRRI